MIYQRTKFYRPLLLHQRKNNRVRNVKHARRTKTTTHPIYGVKEYNVCSVHLRNLEMQCADLKMHLEYADVELVRLVPVQNGINLENRNARQRNMEDADHPTCYMCKCEIRDESDNWIVVDTSFCRFLVCETCCDENSGAYEESEEEDIDMSDMKNALEETTMEDSSSESSSDEES
jgi:hypothetical protein